MNYYDRLLEKQVALLESLVLKITVSDDAYAPPVSLKALNPDDDDRNRSITGRRNDERSYSNDGIIERDNRNQRDGGRGRESYRDRDRDRSNTSDTDDTDGSIDTDRKLSNVSNYNKKARSNANDNVDSGKELNPVPKELKFSVLSVIAKVINKVSATGAALSEQEERIEIARKSGRILRGVRGALVKSASDTLGFWVGLGFEEEGEGRSRRGRVNDDGYDDAYSSDDDYRNRNYGNNGSNNDSEADVNTSKKRRRSYVDHDDFIDIVEEVFDSDISFTNQADSDSDSSEKESNRNRKNSIINDSIDDILGSIG